PMPTTHVHSSPTARCLPLRLINSSRVARKVSRRTAVATTVAQVTGVADGALVSAGAFIRLQQLISHLQLRAGCNRSESSAQNFVKQTVSLLLLRMLQLRYNQDRSKLTVCFTPNQ